MANLTGFDANEHEPSGFDPLPAGDQVAAIVDSEMCDTKNGNGKYLKLTLQVLEGVYKGRQLWDRLNLVNPSADAVRIAKGTLSAICRAVKVMTPKDSQELHNLPLIVRVGLSKHKDTGDMTNVIKKYSPREAAAAAVAATAGTAAPWARK
jgi:hypothetical protein